eukprot:CAMPEP_0184240356 /NCGR_PEP_ID=MMETSP0976-20121227/27852_1 /TAXON_ID=483370 /ORGANISM="non described non described, Strain CCMP2097" /LENGTH=233 /DNA_ID=CAMNT_0026545587 /DNA_START=73 /DNA_END=770 /DNA_ORIENTATION=-
MQFDGRRRSLRDRRRSARPRLRLVPPGRIEPVRLPLTTRLRRPRRSPAGVSGAAARADEADLLPARRGPKVAVDDCDDVVRSVVFGKRGEELGNAADDGPVTLGAVAQEFVRPEDHAAAPHVPPRRKRRHGDEARVAPRADVAREKRPYLCLARIAPHRWCSRRNAPATAASMRRAVVCRAKQRSGGWRTFARSRALQISGLSRQTSSWRCTSVAPVGPRASASVSSADARLS